MQTRPERHHLPAGIDQDPADKSLPQMRLLEHIILDHEDRKASNTKENPGNVTPRLSEGGVLKEQTLRAILSPLSWNVIRLGLERG